MKYMEVSVYGENQFTKEDVKENLEFWFQLNLKRVIAKLNNQKIKEVMEMANALLEEIEREKTLEPIDCFFQQELNSLK